MSPAGARLVTAFLIVFLFVGTLMPGAWKDAAITPLHSPLDLAAAAHVLLFACIAIVLPLTGWVGPTLRALVGTGLALGLLTEGLQFLAIDRHPNFAGLLQDTGGAVLGWLVARYAASRRSA